MPLKICDRIIFDYYTGLARIHSNKPYHMHNTTKLLYLFVYEAQWIPLIPLSDTIVP